MIRYRMAPFCKSLHPPPSPLASDSRKSQVNLALGVRTCHPTRGKCAVMARGEVGVGVGSPLAGFPSNKEIWFFDDFSKVI